MTNLILGLALGFSLCAVLVSRYLYLQRFNGNGEL